MAVNESERVLRLKVNTINREEGGRPLLVFFANTDWYLYNFRRSLALSARDAGYRLLLISPPGPYGEKLAALGLHWEPIPMRRRSLNPLGELLLLGKLWWIFRRQRPDLVHGFTIKCAVYGSVIARFAGVPFRVSAVAGMGYVFTSSDIKARLLRPLVSGLLKFALGGRGSRLVLQNPDDIALFAHARLVEAMQVRLISGSGVDCSRFVERTTLREAGPLRILLAARLLWDKGIAEYVAAARQLHGEGREIRFLLAGDPDPGNPATVPTATVREWDSEGIIEWQGHVDDMPALLGTVDMAVLPSYREGLPKGLIEAAACGLPIITTDVPGCRQVVTDEVDGLIVPVRDAEALAQAIRRLADDPDLAQRLGGAAAKKARERFDERIVIKETLDLYRELLSG